MAEAEILRGDKNIVRGRPAQASVMYNPNSLQQCGAQMINDGIVDESQPEAGDGNGYWLLPSGKAGWIEIMVSGPNTGTPEKPPRDVSKPRR